MAGEEYLNMQKHLLYITKIMLEGRSSLSKIRGVESVWDEGENRAKITFFFNGEATEDELDDFSVATGEIIAHCSNARLEEKFIRLDYPQPLPKSDFWAYQAS